MRYVEVRDSLSLSVLGLGCNNFGSRLTQPESSEVLQAAIDCGVNFFDTADTYGDRGGSEEAVGKAVQMHRESFIVASKFGFDKVDMGYGEGAGPRGSARYINFAINNSLLRLNTDYIDIYYLHSPDPDTPIEHTLEALEVLSHEGKVRTYGVSNLDSSQLEQAISVRDRLQLQNFAFVQGKYSILTRGAEEKTFPLCESHNLSYIPYSPLEYGLLAGKMIEGQPLPGSRLASKPELVNQGLLNAYQAVSSACHEHHVSCLSLALRAPTTFPCVPSVIPAAMNRRQVEMNALALETEIDQSIVQEILARLE